MKEKSLSHRSKDDPLPATENGSWLRQNRGHECFEFLFLNVYTNNCVSNNTLGIFHWQSISLADMEQKMLYNNNRSGVRPVHFPACH